MTRRYAHQRVDDNHGEVVAYLRAHGVWVRSVAGLGDGFPDLLTCYRAVFRLLEVKDGSLIPSRRALTPKEQLFFATCPGPVYLVETPEEALSAATGKSIDSRGRVAVP